jgi:hypothetical protein
MCEALIAPGGQNFQTRKTMFAAARAWSSPCLLSCYHSSLAIDLDSPIANLEKSTQGSDGTV